MECLEWIEWSDGFQPIKIDKINKDDSEEIYVETNKAEGKKCSVCWKIMKDKCDRHGDI